MGEIAEQQEKSLGHKSFCYTLYFCQPSNAGHPAVKKINSQASLLNLC
jgi:hypothetical protein